jgi:hypothetical protein
MPDFRAPDGSNQPINNQTVQHLTTVPPFSLAFLDTRTEAAWEQAAVVYINGVRQSQLIGNYHHSTVFWLPQVAFSQQIMLAGWHKRSGPDGGQPWHASRGRVQGEWAEWDDSGGDLDFNDFRTRTVVLPGLHISPFSLHPQAWTSNPPPSGSVALFLASLANVRLLNARLSDSDIKTTTTQHVEDIFSRILSNYCEHDRVDDSYVPALSRNLQLALALNSIASAFPEGDLRAELQKFVEQILQAGKY